MSNFEYNSIEDLVFSKSFREWVLFQNTDDAAFWQRLEAESAEKKELINHAKAIIYALQCNINELSEKDINEEIQKVLHKLQIRDDEDDYLNYTQAGKHQPGGGIFRSLLSKVVAVVILCLVTVSIYFYSNNTSKAPEDIYETFITKRDKPLINEPFKEDTSANIQLPDGSTIQLKSKSKLTYALNFTNNKREVYLTGEGFFTIKKDPAHPFIVYTSSIITKVLGTSFCIKAYKGDKRAVVIVKTGKVSVYRSSSFTGFSKEQINTGVMVTPNQELVYNKENNELNKALTEKPALLTLEPRKNLFAFKATPVSAVFKILHDSYGIPIVFDEDEMSACSLSAEMGDEPFYAKLNMICKAINASYEVIDGNIIIDSPGCK